MQKLELNWAAVKGSPQKGSDRKAVSKGCNDSQQRPWHHEEDCVTSNTVEGSTIRKIGSD